MFRSKRGSSLVLVLIIFAFVLIIGAGAIVISSTSANQTTQSLAQKQADFTAQSVLNAVIAQVKAGKIVPDATKTISNGIGYIMDSNLGAYQYTIESYDSAKYQFKVSVDAWYPKYQDGSESRMNSIIQGTLKQSTFNVIGQSTGLTSIGDAFNGNVQGDLLLNNSGRTLTIAQGTISGNLELNGNLVLTNGFKTLGTSSSINYLKSTGDVTVYNGTVNANITSGGKFTISGGGHVNGNINAADKSIPNWLPIGGTVTIGPQNVQIDTSAKPWDVTPDLRNSMASNVININMGSDHTITHNCTIIMPNSNNTDLTKLILDATSQDLYVTLKASDPNKTISIARGEAILTLGSNKVYVFLDDGNGDYVNLNVGDTSYNGVFVGNSNYYQNRTDETPNLYFISNFQSNSGVIQNIQFVAGSTLYGYIYAPYASVNLDKNAYSNMPKLIGAVTGSSISFSAWDSIEYRYKNPNSGGTTGGAGTVSWIGDDCKIIGKYIGN